MYSMIIFGLIFVVAGLFFLWLGFKERRACQESRNWPFVEGHITESTVDIRRRQVKGKTTSYYPKVAYTYPVLGETYTGKGITIGAIQGFSSQAKVQEQLARYPLGQPVMVYYNPQQPAQATLEPGATRGAWGTVIMGLICGVVGLVAFVLGLTIAN